MNLPTPPVIEGQHLLNGEILVTVAGRPLDPVRSQQVRNYSAGGFEWGYGGSGPAQLALALLLEAGLPDEVAKAHCQTFKWDVFASLDASHFRLPVAVVKDWVWRAREN